MNPTIRFMRRAASAVKQQLKPSPELAAWRHADSLAATTPRHMPGHIRMLDYDIEYADLLSLCPQWHDIFVQRSLDFETANPTPRILDCGSNVGLASLFFKRRYPSARVTAYEADAALCAITRRNLERNGITDVEVVHAALWTATGSVTFRAEGSDSGMIDGLAGGVLAAGVTVPSVRLRDVLERERVDLLKLDIEGAEDPVLADCEPVLDSVNAMVIDLHEFDPRDRQSPRFLDRLSRCGFTYSIDELLAQPWRPPVAAKDSPFPGLPLVWTMTVRAWRA